MSYVSGQTRTKKSKAMFTSIILPTYNERDNIGKLIKSILKIVEHLKEIIVVDDDSPDRTWEIVKKIQRRNKKVRLLRRIGKRGVASAIYDGICLSKGDVILWMDCDFSMPPQLIPKLIESLNDYDVAIGSRYVKGGKDDRKFVRVLTSKIINLFASILLGFKIRDYTTGFVAAKRHVINKVKFLSEGHGEYCIEFLYKCIKKNFRIKEVPYSFTNREKGKSKTSEYVFSILTYGIWYIIRIIKVRFR